jgi:hypothetical protein
MYVNLSAARKTAGTHVQSVNAFVEVSDRARAPDMAFVLEQPEADLQSNQHLTVNLRVY